VNLLSNSSVIALVSALVASLLVSPSAFPQLISTLEPCDHLDRWDRARDAARIEREYVSNGLQIERDPERGQVLDWRFELRSIQYSDLFLRREIDDPFQELRLWVRNVGEAVSFTLKLGDASGAEYTTQPIPLPANAPWQEVAFPLEEFHLAGWSADPDGAFDFPLRYLALITFDVAPGHRSHLRFDDVRLVQPTPQEIEVVEIKAPRRLVAGERGQVQIALRPQRLSPWPASAEAATRFRLSDALSLQFVREGTVPWQQAVIPSLRQMDWREGQEVKLGPIEFTMPRFAWGGAYTLALFAPNVRFTGHVLDTKGGLAQMNVTQSSPSAEIPTCAIRQHHGAPTLFINDQPHSGMSYMTYHPNRRYFSQFGQIGVHLYSFSATPTEAAYGLAPPCWVAPDRFDYSGFEERAQMLLEADPEAYFFPRLYLSSPRWWDAQHPDDLVTFDPGDGQFQPFFHSPPDKRVPSWASEAWRRDTALALRRFVEYVRSSPYAGRVVGYHLASGTTEEWMMWGANEGQWVDYSPVNAARFREWLRQKYDTEAALQGAWNDPNVTFATAALPTRAERERTFLGSFRDPQREQQVIDFYEYNSDLVAETIAYLARAVKEATQGKSLVGVFYGYVLQLCGEQRLQNAGHLALRKVWNCPDVDFLTSPTSYAFRTPGTGYSHFMSLTDSIRLHGKLWFDENDIRTYLTGGAAGQWGRTDTYEETLRQERREFANVLCQAVGQWWFDMGGGWYDDPRLLQDIAALNRIAEQSVDWDRSPVDEIAVVVDDTSLVYQQVGHPLSGPLLLTQLPELGRLGAPVGFYALDDLADIPPKKLYLFLNAFAPTVAHRQAMEQLKGGDRVLAWVYAPGLYRDGQIDVSAMEELTGIRLAMERQASKLDVVIGGEDDTPAGLAGVRYGAGFEVAPTFLADDPQVDVWGTLAESERPGLVVRRFADWTSVYSAAPQLPTALLRHLARLAGVHLYLADPRPHDVVYANRSLLALCVNEAGPRTLVLPQPGDVFDLFEDSQQIASGERELSVEMKQHETRLFRVVPRVGNE